MSSSPLLYSTLKLPQPRRRASTETARQREAAACENLGEATQLETAGIAISINAMRSRHLKARSQSLRHCNSARALLAFVMTNRLRAGLSMVRYCGAAATPTATTSDYIAIFTSVATTTAIWTAATATAGYC